MATFLPRLLPDPGPAVIKEFKERAEFVQKLIRGEDPPAPVGIKWRLARRVDQ